MEALTDDTLRQLLAASAVIAMPEYHAVENCLWVTGTSKDKGQYRQLFVCVELLDTDEIKISVTLATDEVGRSTYIKWGHTQWLTVSEIAAMCHLMIESIHNGDGEMVKVMN